jgi:hypothetical protein
MENEGKPVNRKDDNLAFIDEEAEQSIRDRKRNQKIGMTALAVLLMIGAIMFVLVGGQRKEVPSYTLAMDLKTAGLPVEIAKMTADTFMYDEARATGKELDIKINHYTNNDFMYNVLNNIEKEKKDRLQPPGPPRYAADLYIVTVMKEPSKGRVKKEMEKLLGKVREY